MANVNTVEPSNNDAGKQAEDSSNKNFGIYIGEVIQVDIENVRDGTLKVGVPSLGYVPTDEKSTVGIYLCKWSSPFAGSTPIKSIGQKTESYIETVKSYGMWMVPPDVGNRVLIAFADGNTKNGYVIGCTFPDSLNYMVPGMASGKSYGDPSIQVPVAEKNKKDEKTTHLDATRPIAPYLAEAIVKQGLINDPIRGAGSASSMREAPSQVFGILTPGPFKSGSSASESGTKSNTHRIGGHQFIMDDNPGSRMIRLRTAGGTQLMLDDTTGSIYMINKSGKGWFEIDQLGNINFYAEGSINIRSKGNLNLRSDYNVNIEAGHNVNIRAAGDNVAGTYLGPNPMAMLGGPPLGTGGSINLDAAGDIKQFSALNHIVTAAGGDVQLSAGSKFNVNSTVSADIFTLGPLGLTALTGASIFSVGAVGITGTTGVQIVGLPKTLINSGPAFVFIDPIPVATAAPLGYNSHKDQPASVPEFDVEAALKGKSAVKSVGKRQGRQDTIKSIITNLITAEPYAGHAQGADPGKEDPAAKGASDKVTSDLPPAASTSDGKPDDVQTPSGTKAGEGYKDSNGNTVSTSPNSPSNLANRAKVAANSAAARTNSAAKAIGDAGAKVTAEVNKLKDSIPTYADIQNAINDFQKTVEKKIDEVLGISKFIDSLKAQIPPIRFPTTNARVQKVIDTVKELKELEAELKEIYLLKNLLAGISIGGILAGAIANMKNSINDVMKRATSAVDAVNKLKEAGIEVFNDAGSIIYKDSQGNMIIDYSNGIGPMSRSLAFQSQIAETYDSIKNSIDVPLSNNQAQSIAYFANDIGIENFKNSNVLAALNEGKYSEIPRLMMQWSLGPEPGTNLPTPEDQLVYRQDFNDKRYFQGQVFQSPDNLDIGPPEGTVDGELSPRQMADIIKARREEFNAANYAGPTEYYGGPGR